MYFIFQKHVVPQFRAVMTIFLENKVPSGDPTVPSKEFKGILSRSQPWALKEGRGWSYWKTQLVGLIWTFCPVLLVHDRNSSNRNGSRYLYQRTFRNVIQWSNDPTKIQVCSCFWCDPFLMWVNPIINHPNMTHMTIKNGWIVGSLPPNQQTGRVSCSSTTGQPVDGLREFAGQRTSRAATFAQILWPGRRRLVRVGAGWCSLVGNWWMDLCVTV